MKILKGRSPSFWGFLVLIGLFVIGSVFGQLSQSGGAGNTTAVVSALPAGSNTIGNVNAIQSGAWSASISQGGNTASVTAASALKVDGSGVTQPVRGTVMVSNAGFGVTGSLPAGDNIIGSVRMIPPNTCGTTAYDSGAVALSRTSTVLTSTATCVTAILFNNITSSTQTVDVTDNQGTPVSYVTSFQIPANSNFVYSLHGMRLANGIRWSATSASSVNAQVIGYQ
jgi:hypothetical protein